MNTIDDAGSADAPADKGGGDWPPRRLLKTELGKIIGALPLSIGARTFSTIFDVGSNVGQSAELFRELWQGAKIFCFEPVESSFSELQKTLDSDPNTSLHKIALSDSNGSAFITAHPKSTGNTLIPSNLSGKAGLPSEEISIVRGDDFCKKHEIEHINYLKIDAEGHDLAVLRGFSSLTSMHAIDIIQVEAGMHSGNKLHVPFEKFKGYLEVVGYQLLRVVEQSWERDRPLLRRANLIFISGDLVEKSRHAKR